jgi:hypothetical protein
MPDRKRKPWLDILAAAFAGIAAVFWFASAWGTLPPMLTYWDGAPANDPFYSAIRFSAQMNTIAAAFSGLSALCVGITAAQRWFHFDRDRRIWPS